MYPQYLSDPVWHDVGAGCPVVQVEDDHAQNDGEGDKDHCEHDVVDDNWDGKGRFRDFVSQQQHEDGESDEDRNRERHLLSCQKNNQKLSGFELKILENFCRFTGENFEY